jgi:hypothetical protein
MVYVLGTHSNVFRRQVALWTPMLPRPLHAGTSFPGSNGSPETLRKRVLNANIFLMRACIFLDHARYRVGPRSWRQQQPGDPSKQLIYH